MYFITMVDSKSEDLRCVGYFDTFEKAEERVLDNTFDINEAGCYDYAVIENIPEGIYQYDSNPAWYKWNDLDEVYEKIDYVPEPFKNQIGFCIG